MQVEYTFYKHAIHIAYTLHSHGIHMTTHGMHMAVGTHGIHMECTQTHIEYLRIHMAYIGNTHCMHMARHLDHALQLALGCAGGTALDSDMANGNWTWDLA